MKDNIDLYYNHFYYGEKYYNICFNYGIVNEEDLLDSSNPYTLTDTGQGLHRVQPCKRVN